MARGSWRRRWPAPFMMRSSASPWASTRTRASKTGTRSSSLPWMTSSGRGATFGAQATARSSRSSRVQASTSAGKAGSLMMPTSRACSSRRLGCEAQSSKSAGAPSVATPRTSGSAAAAQRASAPPVPKPASHTPRDALVVPQVADRGARGRRASRRARSCPPSRRTRGRPAPWPASPSRGQPVGQLRERRRRHGGGADVARVAVGQHDGGRRDGVGPHRRPGQVGGQEVPARREAELHGGWPGYSASAARGGPARAGSRGCGPRRGCRGRSRGRSRPP